MGTHPTIDDNNPAKDALQAMLAVVLPFFILIGLGLVFLGGIGLESGEHAEEAAAH